jgi:CspA family cold shock protein
MAQAATIRVFNRLRDWFSKVENWSPIKIFLKEVEMAEGTIKKLAEKGFGFIDTGSNKDLFFHLSSLDGCSFEELQVGQKVEFTHGDGPKGPVAENVKIV